MAAMGSLGGLGTLGGDLLNQNNQSEAGPEVAILNNGQHANDTLNFSDPSVTMTTTTTVLRSGSTADIMQEKMDGANAGYDSRTITKQTLSKLQMNSKFGTFTRKTCESIEKFNFTPDHDNNAAEDEYGGAGDGSGGGGADHQSGRNDMEVDNNDDNGERLISSDRARSETRLANGTDNNAELHQHRHLDLHQQQQQQQLRSQRLNGSLSTSGLPITNDNRLDNNSAMSGESQTRLNGGGIGGAGGPRGARNPSPNANLRKPATNGRDDSPQRGTRHDSPMRLHPKVSELEKEVESLRAFLNTALTERDQALSALRAYEELLKRISEANNKQKRTSSSSLGSGGIGGSSSPLKEPMATTAAAAAAADGERLKKRNAMLEKTIDNLEQTVQDTMARMNDVKDVNHELKNVLTDQQDMLAQYKSTIEQKTFEYRDLLAKHEAHIDALVTEHKRDRALLEKQITLLRAEAHMKSLDNERLASECRIKGEQLARMTEMLNELRQAY